MVRTALPQAGPRPERGEQQLRGIGPTARIAWRSLRRDSRRGGGRAAATAAERLLGVLEQAGPALAAPLALARPRRPGLLVHAKAPAVCGEGVRGLRLRGVRAAGLGQRAGAGGGVAPQPGGRRPLGGPRERTRGAGGDVDGALAVGHHLGPPELRRDGRDDAQRALAELDQRAGRDQAGLRADRGPLQHRAVGRTGVGDGDPAVRVDLEGEVETRDVRVVHRHVRLGGAADDDAARVQQVDAAGVRTGHDVQGGGGAGRLDGVVRVGGIEPEDDAVDQRRVAEYGALVEPAALGVEVDVRRGAARAGAGTGAHRARQCSGHRAQRGADRRADQHVGGGHGGMRRRRSGRRRALARPKHGQPDLHAPCPFQPARDGGRHGVVCILPSAADSSRTAPDRMIFGTYRADDASASMNGRPGSAAQGAVLRTPLELPKTRAPAGGRR